MPWLLYSKWLSSLIIIRTETSMILKNYSHTLSLCHLSIKSTNCQVIVQSVIDFRSATISCVWAMDTKTEKNIHQIMYLTHKAKLIYPILITLFSVIARFLLLYDPRPEVSSSKKVCLHLYIDKWVSLKSAEELYGSYSF